MEYFKEFLNKNTFRKEELIGYNQMEILEMENLMNYPFPKGIKEFMMLMGKSFPIFTPMKEVIFNQHYKRELLDVISEDQNLDLKKLKENPFLIIGIDDSNEELYGGYLWTIIELNNDNNPYVIKVDSNSIVYDSNIRFSDYIKNKLEKRLNRTKLFLRYHIDLKRQLRFVNYSNIKELSIELGEINEDEFYTTISKLHNLRILHINEGCTRKGLIKKISFPSSSLIESLYINLSGLKNINLDKNSLINLSTIKLIGDVSDLPIEFENCKNLTSVVLTSNSLFKFPKVLLKNHQIKILSINGKITEIPKEIGLLNKLTSLTFFKNNISCIPDEVYNFTSLLKLNLCGNIISSIGEKMKNLKNLETLNLSENCLSSKEIKKLKSFLPNTGISLWNQKQQIKKDYNTSFEYKIEIEEKYFEKFIAALEEEKFYFVRGTNQPGSTNFINSNKLEYPFAVKILDKIKKS